MTTPKTDLPDFVRAFVVSVARKYAVRTEDILGKCRRRQVVRARNEAMTVVQDTLDLTYPDTGHLFGVNYTSVMDARKEYESRPTWPKETNGKSTRHF
jgi:chromosomal replication initiation ATPase DnaA